jgi:hypothetical protein
MIVDFRPQRAQHISLCEALDRLLDTGVVALGEVTLSVAEVDLIYLGLQLVITSIKNGGHQTPDYLLPDHGWPAADGLRYAGAASPCPANALGPKALPAAPPVSASTAAGSSPPLGLARPVRAPSPAAGQGLGKLVLTVIKLLHDLLERQALRRIEQGALNQSQIERLGVTLMNQAQQIENLRQELGLQAGELNLDLGPLGKLL